MFSEGIELRLLNREEFIQKLKDKVRKGYHLCLSDPLKPTTIEEIERYKNKLWEDQILLQHFFFFHFYFNYFES